MASMNESDTSILLDTKRPTDFKDFKHLEGGPQPPELPKDRRGRNPLLKGKIAVASVVSAGLAGVGMLTAETTRWDPLESLRAQTPQEQPAYPVSSKNEPHKVITVEAGDTESAIAAREGHEGDYKYMNMLNNQLPESRQNNRTLVGGDTLTVPTDSK